MATPLPPSLPSREVSVLRGHKGPVQVVKFNSDGKYLLSAGQDRSVYLWNPYRNEPPEQGEAGVLSPPSRAAGGADTMKTGLLINEYRAHGYEVMDVCVSTDNTRFASCGGDRCIYYWDTTTGTVLRKLFGHEQRINSVCFNADATVLCSGGNDKAVRCWDMRSASRLPIQVMSDFHDNVTCVVTDRHSIVASALDGCVRSYDLRTGRMSEDTISQPVTSMAMSNDRNCMLLSTMHNSGTLLLLEREAGTLLNK